MNGALVYRGFNGAAGLVNMHAIVELAIVDERPHFRKIMRQLLLRDINQTQLPYARRINNAAAKREVKHFGKRGSVQALAAPTAYILCAQLQLRKHDIYKRRFTHAGVAA